MSVLAWIIAASFAGGAPDLGMFFALFFNNMAYLASLFLLIACVAPGGSIPMGHAPARNTPAMPAVHLSSCSRS